MPHREAPNKGPGAGGAYMNDTNVLAHSGETHPTEPHDMTGGQMAYNAVETHSLPSSTAAANVRGGNGELGNHRASRSDGGRTVRR